MRHRHAPLDHDHDHDDAHNHAASNHGEHNHHHDHDDARDHDHEHRAGAIGLVGSLLHRHRHEVAVDPALESNAEGIRTLWTSLVALAVTGAIQLAISIQSGSVGLLADTIHNFSDALTAVPLWLAFVVGKRPANRRYTYGYGRAEDAAGLAIVLIIFISALLALWETYQKLVHPSPIHQVGWVMAAALVGFLGNEAVALLRIRTGRRIGSAALEADGAHARVDGLTSLGVLVGAVAVALGAPIADPIVGLLISVAILFVTKDATVAMWHRLMDAVDPTLVEQAEAIARSTPGVVDVHDLRVRWLGHRLQASLQVTVDEDLSLSDAHAISEEVRHRLFHAFPRLADASIHVDPCGHSGVNHHGTTAHHQTR